MTHDVSDAHLCSFILKLCFEIISLSSASLSWYKKDVKENLIPSTGLLKKHAKDPAVLLNVCSVTSNYSINGWLETTVFVQPDI